jgi:AcrR family transcriptional regulator
MQMHYREMQAHGAAEQGAGDTRDRLIRAAEKLFAERGIAAVSLREINREAGAKNAVAVQYHFGDRDGLLRAVLHKHWPAVEARRHALLDEYEADPDGGGVRSLTACLVRPLAAKLSDEDGGREYLQIHSELLNMPREEDDPARLDPHRDSIQRWRALVAPLLEEDATRLHRRFTVMRFSAAELARRASTGRHTDDRLFVSHLIDLCEALLLAPTSAETRRLADARDESRRRRRRAG